MWINSQGKTSAKVSLSPLLGVAVISLVGLTLIIRGYFLEHKLPSTQIGGVELSYNDLLPVANVAGINSKGKVISYGSNITDGSKLPDTTGVWLRATSDQATFIGELRSSTFTPKYSLPSGLNELRLFETQELLYVTKGDISEYSKVVWAGVATTELLNTRSGDMEYISAYFEPETKDIYAVKRQRDGKMIVELLRISGDIYEVFETRDFKSAEIIKASAVLGEIWLLVDTEDDSHCVRLDLKTKEYVTRSCIDANKGVSSYYLARTSHSQNYPGGGDKILKLFQGTNTEILKANETEVYAALAWRDNSLSFLKYSITGFGVELSSFEVYDAASKAVLQSITDLPSMSFPLETALDANGNIYVLVDLNGVEHIYYRTGSNPSGSTTTTTTTTTTTSSSSEEDNGWYDVEVEACGDACNFTFLK